MSREKREAHEVFVYRYDRSMGRTREFVGNFTLATDLPRVLLTAGRGRYRVEWRDDRRWIVRVEVMVVRSDGRVVRGEPLLGPRKVGPPRDLPDAATVERRRMRSIKRPRE